MRIKTHLNNSLYQITAVFFKRELLHELVVAGYFFSFGFQSGKFWRKIRWKILTIIPNIQFLLFHFCLHYIISVQKSFSSANCVWEPFLSFINKLSRITDLTEKKCRISSWFQSIISIFYLYLKRNSAPPCPRSDVCWFSNKILLASFQLSILYIRENIKQRLCIWHKYSQKSYFFEWKLFEH